MEPTNLPDEFYRYRLLDKDMKETKDHLNLATDSCIKSEIRNISIYALNVKECIELRETRKKLTAKIQFSRDLKKLVNSVNSLFQIF